MYSNEIFLCSVYSQKALEEAGQKLEGAGISFKVVELHPEKKQYNLSKEIWLFNYEDVAKAYKLLDNDFWTEWWRNVFGSSVGGLQHKP